MIPSVWLGFSSNGIARFRVKLFPWESLGPWCLDGSLQVTFFKAGNYSAHYLLMSFKNVKNYNGLLRILKGRVPGNTKC